MSEQAFVTSLTSTRIEFPWRAKHIRFATEIKITHNRVDVVYFELKAEGKVGSVIAVEAKLRDWRRAIHQAHRNKLFADRTYVALPAQFASSAIRNLSEFRTAAIGLIVLDEDRTHVYYHPPMNTQKSSFHISRARASLDAATSSATNTRPTPRGVGCSLAPAL